MKTLPLSGLKVVEFTHMVMGPTTGLILADLGADVVKIEPLGGDNTRRLRGSGAGYFPMYSRNKRSLCLDLKSQAGLAIARRLIDQADVLIENFRPGAMAALGLGETDCATSNPGLIYCSAKGFLSGPYENRTALDEVAQMMGGLAYMTGPPGRPLRAGASVLDVMGGVFGAIGVLAALHSRGQGRGGAVIRSGLYENCVFLVGQHMAQYAVTGSPAAPMPARVSAWAIYDLFATRDGDQVFVGVVTDSQWRTFCAAFGLDDLGGDEALAANNGRVEARERIIPRVQALIAGYDKADILARLEEIGLPFAPVAKPQDLFEDPHLAAGGLLPVELPDGGRTALPALPMEIDGARPPMRIAPPKPGAHSRSVLADAGFGPDVIQALVASGVVGEAA